MIHVFGENGDKGSIDVKVLRMLFVVSLKLSKRNFTKYEIRHRAKINK